MPDQGRSTVDVHCRMVACKSQFRWGDFPEGEWISRNAASLPLQLASAGTPEAILQVI